MIGYGTLADLARLRPGVRRGRASSYDRSGGNRDWQTIGTGETATIADLEGPGCVRHIWMTFWCDDRRALRKVLLHAWWDGEAEPSVAVPLGDFFGLGHGLLRNFVSLPLQMSPESGRGFNCWFPMPFQTRARFAVTNEAEAALNLYYYIDYETYPPATTLEGYGRFHAQWRRENPTAGWADPSLRDDPERLREAWATANTTGADNYVILEAEGQGHYVGCHLDIDCFSRQANDWYGEGDDMIFIDGEPWPPALHGTGTEDYFNTAFCPTQEYSAPYHGLILYQGTDDWKWRGKNTLYRYHIEDPIFFERSIRVTIEHGHANKLSNDYTSTAYWYQTEPHKPFPPMLPVQARLPRL